MGAVADGPISAGQSSGSFQRLQALEVGHNDLTELHVAACPLARI